MSSDPDSNQHQQSQLSPSSPSSATSSSSDPSSSSSSSSIPLPSPALPLSDNSNTPSSFHPLNRKWSLWYKEPSKERPSGEEWVDNVKPVTDFDSIESFWAIHNNIIPPSQLPNKGDYHIFEKGIFPKWEDPINKKGGHWVIELKRNPENNGIDDNLNRAWLISILSIIGENIDESLYIVGIVVSIRKGKNKIQLWTREGKKNIIMAIGQHWKKLLLSPWNKSGNNIGAGLKNIGPMGYESHDDVLKSLSHNSFASNYKYEIA